MARSIITPRGCGDSYEALLDRFDTAVDGGEAGPPKAVVIKVDSPGGKSPA